MRVTAIQSAGDAIDVTREYLFSRSRRDGLTLALMAVFLGPTGVSGPPGPIQVEEEALAFEGDVPTLGEVAESVPVDLVVAVVALGVGVIGLYGLLSAFMEFGFVHSLVRDTAALRAPARDHWPRALALFAFRAVVWVAIAGAVIGATLALAGIASLPLPGAVATPALVLVGLGGYLLNRFTTDFVVPIMYHERRGLVSGWKRLWRVMRPEWRQFAAYLPVRVILEVALGIAFTVVLGILLVLAVVLIGVPLGILLVLVFGPVGLAGVALVLVPIALGLVAALMVPFHTYLRYYTLLVLGDAHPALDLVPDKRAPTRTPSRESAV